MDVERWIDFKCKSGLPLFSYNIKTGEQRWVNDQSKAIPSKELRCIAIQTDDLKCENGCTSIYVNNDANPIPQIFNSTNTLTEPLPVNQVSIKSETNNISLDEEDFGLHYGETSGIYEVSLGDDLEEFQVEYPPSEEEDNDHSSSEEKADMEVDHSSNNSQENDTKPPMKQLRPRNTIKLTQKAEEAMESQLDSVPKDAFKDKYIDPAFRIKTYHKCTFCYRQFDSSGKLKDHIRTHTGEKPFGCNYCERKFAKKCNLLRHLRRHTGERNYPCTLCEKKFIDSAELQRHMISHTKTRAFGCPYCDKKFAQKNTLTCHLRRHTGIGRSFDCEICGRQFEHGCDLRRHVQIHTGEKPFSCDFCDKKFPTKYSVNRHMRSHTGEKPFTCKVCNKKFSEKKNLDYHMTIHTGEKNYKCTTCDKAFARKLYWERHRKKCFSVDYVNYSESEDHAPLSMVHEFKNSENPIIVEVNKPEMQETF